MLAPLSGSRTIVELVPVRASDSLTVMSLRLKTPIVKPGQADGNPLTSFRNSPTIPSGKGRDLLGFKRPSGAGKAL